MAKVSELMNRAARECRLKPPLAWVPATDLSALECKDFLLDTVEELLQRLDWPAPVTKELVIAGLRGMTKLSPSIF